MAADLHEDLRREVRDLCKAFPDSYWRELDQARAYPDAFVKALTDAGYLAALIPAEYGGARPGAGAASNTPAGGGHGGRGPGAEVRGGRAAAPGLGGAEADVPAGDRRRPAATAGVWRHRTDNRLRYDAAENHRHPQGRRLHRPRSEGVDLARRALRPAAARRADDANRAGEEADRRVVDPAGRPARRG